MRTIYLNKLALIAMLTLVGSNAAYAESDDSGYGNQRQGRRGPPPQALEACEALVEGDPCSFTGRNEEQLNGSCFSPREDILACRPEGHEGRGHRRGQGYGQE
ncbi:MAG: hypothetical protein KJO76_00805 [Gammaproteobacteria bacterium]|nr:hypothetical protein [Gammaproteobacteria bacterium]MBT8444363.1 hypothetical protein [Gammaproteobacteria bacterium]